MEIWKDIDGYEKYYQVSNQGRIKRKHYIGTHQYGTKLRSYTHTELILTLAKNSAGYYRTRLHGDATSERLFVHRIVAIAFLEKEDGKDIVNHKDGNKTNNSHENLEWVTRSENSLHSVNVLKNIPNTIGIHEKTPVIKIDKISGEVLGRYSSITEASKLNGGISHVSSVCRGERLTAGGYKWAYAK